MLNYNDGPFQEGEWDSSPSIPPSTNNTGSDVSGGGHFLLGGAEPLTNQQLSVGHSDLVRPSRILDGLQMNEGIDIAADALKRREDAPTHLMPIVEGLALRPVLPGSDGGWSDD